MIIVWILAIILVLGGVFFIFFSNEGDGGSNRGAPPLAQPSQNIQMTSPQPSQSMRTGALTEGFIKPGANKRVCAWVIDICIISFVLAFVTTPIINHLLLFFYILFRDSFNGQSLGKRIVGLQVIDFEDKAISIKQGVIRNIGVSLPFVNFIFLIAGYIMIRTSAEGQRLEDTWANTRVTDLRPERSDRLFLVLSVCVFLIYMVLFVGIGAHQYGQLMQSQGGLLDMKEIVADGPFAENETIAKVTLKKIYLANETFKVANKKYPADISDLLRGFAPYLDKDYCQKSHSGYAFDCEFAVDGYLIQAFPVEPGVTGERIYAIDQSGMIKVSP